jgi:hypothetical protein
MVPQYEVCFGVLDLRIDPNDFFDVVIGALIVTVIEVTRPHLVAFIDIADVEEVFDTAVISIFIELM